MTKLARNIFLIIFAVSTLLFLGATMMFSLNAQSSAPVTMPTTPTPAQTPQPSHSIAETEKPAVEANFTLVSAAITSLASLIGFVTTTVITWRKEKRESDLAAMERKKLELELEKSRIELEELKREKKK